MTKSSARSSKIMWCQIVQLHPLSDTSHHVPNDVLGDTHAPRRPMPTDCAEDSTRAHLRELPPTIDCLLDPSRHRNGPDMTAFADQIRNSPVSLSNLQIFNRKRREFSPAQSSADKHRDHCEVASTAQINLHRLSLIRAGLDLGSASFPCAPQAVMPLSHGECLQRAPD